MDTVNVNKYLLYNVLQGIIKAHDFLFYYLLFLVLNFRMHCSHYSHCNLI